MGTSTDGQIDYGIPFEEGYEFPWESEKHAGDWEGWWVRGICGYKPKFKIYDESGEYLDGTRPSDYIINEYHDQESEFSLHNPMPVTFINYCSDSVPMWMVSLPNKGLRNSRGYLTEFDPTLLVVTDEERQVLIDFCKEHCAGGEFDEMPELDPKWYLTSTASF